MVVGIGIDDVNCNDFVNMIGDMKFMVYIYCVVYWDVDVLILEKIFEMVMIDGVCLLGMDYEIGFIEIGKCVDFILFDLCYFQMIFYYYLVVMIVFQVYGNEVDIVLIDGNVVMENCCLSFFFFECELVFFEEVQSCVIVILQWVNMVVNLVWCSFQEMMLLLYLLFFEEIVVILVWFGLGGGYDFDGYRIVMNVVFLFFVCVELLVGEG